MIESIIIELIGLLLPLLFLLELALLLKLMF